MKYKSEINIDGETIEHTRVYCYLPQQAIVFPRGMFPRTLHITQKPRKSTGGMFSSPLEAFNTNEELVLFDTYKNASGADIENKNKKLLVVIDVPSNLAQEGKVNYSQLFLTCNKKSTPLNQSRPQEGTKNLVAAYSMGRWRYKFHCDPTPDSDYKLTKKSDLQSNAERIANLFYDYWDKGTGFKQLLFFHWRHHTGLAKKLSANLKQEKNLTNDEIARRISEAYKQASKTTGFDADGSFAKRCSHAIRELTDGYCLSINEYNKAINGENVNTWGVTK